MTQKLMSRRDLKKSSQDGPISLNSSGKEFDCNSKESRSLNP